MKGSEILVACLEREGVEAIFAYPGGASMEFHQALTKSKIRTILPRHEQGGAFAAEGYARATGRAGVCMATSGPGATNLVTGIADAYMDSIPLVADHRPGAAGDDRQGRVSGNGFFRHDAAGCEAQLSGHGHQRHPARRQGGVLHRANRPARPGGDGCAEEHPAGRRRSRCSRRKSICAVTIPTKRRATSS